MATVIDTLALAERLEQEYGDEPERARQHARILGDLVIADIATKRDVDELRTDMEHQFTTARTETQREFTSVRGEIATLRSEVEREFASVRGEIATLRLDMEREFAAVRSEMREMETRIEARLERVERKVAESQAGMAKWFTGVMIAQAAAIVALLRLLPGSGF